MKVKEVMNKKVFSISPDEGISKVIESFSKKGISGLPVIKEDKLVGIITDCDIIKKLNKKTPKIHFASSHDFILIAAGLKSRNNSEKLKKEMEILKKFKVKDFMTKELYTVEENEDFREAAGLMNKKKINRIPVLNKKGKMVGIVARQDIIKALTKC